MELLKSILEKSLQKRGYSKKIKILSAINCWEKAVGRKIADHSTAERVIKGIMIVSVSDSVWLYHLSTMKKDIINKLNRLIDSESITDIFFVQKREEKYNFKKVVEEKNIEKYYLPSLDAEEQDAIKNILREIPKKYIKERFCLQSVLEKEFKRRKYIKNQSSLR